MQGALPYPDGRTLVALGFQGPLELGGVLHEAGDGTLLALRDDSGWSTPFPALPGVVARPLHVYDDGSVLVVGALNDRLEIDGVVLDHPPGEVDGTVLARLGPEGTVRWGQVWPRFIGSTRHATALPGGSVVVVAFLREDTIVDPGGSHELAIDIPEGGYGFALLRIGPDGAIEWVSAGRGGSGLRVYDLAYDAVSDTLAVGGTMDGAGLTTFGIGQPDPLEHDPASFQPFVARYDGTGRIDWLAFADGRKAYTAAVHPLPDGSILAGGTHLGVLRFPDSDIPPFAPVSSTSAWIGWFDRGGVGRWARSSVPGGSGLATATAVHAGADGSTYLVGTLEGRVAFGTPPVVGWTAPEDEPRAYAMRLNSDGGFTCGLLLPGELELVHVGTVKGGQLGLSGGYRGSAMLGERDGATLFMDSDRNDGFYATIEL